MVSTSFKAAAASEDVARRAHGAVLDGDVVAAAEELSRAMAEPSPHTASTWRTSETVTSSGAVESRQWIELRKVLVQPDEAGARELGRRYLDEIGDFTHGLVRTRRGHGRTSLVLAGGPTLLRFGAAEVEVRGDRVECRYPIVGGLLAAFVVHAIWNLIQLS